MSAFSFSRLIALLRKETIEILRDMMTLRIIIAIPIMQLFLFGYAINADPKHLPAGLLAVQDSKYTRTIAAALVNSGYYDIRIIRSEAEAEDGLARGDLMFVIQMPPDFDRAVDRGEVPQVLKSTPTPPIRQPSATRWRRSDRLSPTSTATFRRSDSSSRRRRRSSLSSTRATILSN